MLRWRRARAGCSSVMRWWPRARWRIWPSRWRRARCGVASGAPRPIARTRVGCANCSPMGGCRRRGSRTSMFANDARGLRLRHTLVDERTQWMRRIQATLYHHGVSGTPEKLRTRDGRAFLDALEVPADARERIEIALAMVEAIEARIAP